MKRAVIIEGDGIGPEVIASAVQVLEAVSPGLEMVEGCMGLQCHTRTGSYLPQSTIDLLNDSDAALFGAITSPADRADYRSPLLSLRKSMDLYANIRPVKRLHPSVGLVDLDVVIVRENTEGMYTGEEREVPGGIVTERKVTEYACRRIVDKAIELCRADGGKKVTCVHKSNVLRRSDGLFREVFLDRMKGSGLEASELLVDAAAAALVSQPRKLDFLVTLNLYGDILSDEAAALAGGLGFAPSVNLGEKFALFEPTHGSAPDIAGMDLANPTAAILSAAMMLRYLGSGNAADRVEKAVPAALEQGIRTRDAGGSLGTREFTRRYLEVLSSC
ncbi:isocitrate/isopropylmalate dehydrogenase family protein [Methanomassiliicoccus luminyensis]|jgi:isopropylmalate/isohomocitrate dehydrogenase-like protein|uniref:isocitrate/isopropylmalate dehydrogenase family protein n=1 Tax=Methanomassiliicoccus luminyensis TaxID=1080712 RepID=UPI00037F8811|nr:isocitrate/isopropylmalate dehydrogenase family protein [Methanomassiliicoccus luminyensis]